MITFGLVKPAPLLSQRRAKTGKGRKAGKGRSPRRAAPATRQRFSRATPNRYGAYKPITLETAPAAVAAAAAVPPAAGGATLIGIAAGLLAALALLERPTAKEPQIPGLAPEDSPTWGPANQKAPSWAPIPPPDWWPTGSIGTLGDLRTNIGVTLNYVTDVGGTGTNIQTGSIPINTYAINPDGLEVETIGDNVYVYAKYPDGSRGGIQADGQGLYKTTWTVTTTFAPAIEGDPGRPIPAYPGSRQALPNPFIPAPQPVTKPDPVTRPFDPWDLPLVHQNPAPIEVPQEAPVPVTVPKTPGLPQVQPVPTLKPARPPAPQLIPPLLPELLPDPAAPPQLWPPNLEVPWPGADPIGQTAAQPRPDLASIAKELGRQEQKLAQLGAGKGGPDLEKLLEQIADLLPDPPAYTFQAGAYQLAPVCDRDEEGNLLDPLESTWPAGSGELAELRHKVDALAELFQFAKIWKQPICKGTPPQGQPVTVTFEEEVN